jgi:hypothetical protein
MDTVIAVSIAAKQLRATLGAEVFDHNTARISSMCIRAGFTLPSKGLGRDENQWSIATTGVFSTVITMAMGGKNGFGLAFIGDLAAQAAASNRFSHDGYPWFVVIVRPIRNNCRFGVLV